MRNNLIVLAVFAAMSMPARAARPISVGELQQTLTTAHASHQADDAIMQQLSDVRLTARLTGTSLQKLVANSPGPKTTEALRAIAGASAFLDPPPNELPAIPAPPIATQKVIIGRSIDHVSHTLPTLPNFLATRETVQYVDTLKGMQQEPVPRGGLLLVGTVSAPIGFHDGRETDDPTVLASNDAPKKKGNAKEVTAPAAIQGLVSWGEFGPILGVVLMDVAKGKLSWARWEQEDGKPIAVFQFSVDRSISDYSVSYCCQLSNAETGGRITAAVRHQRVTFKPGYHSRLEVDPETGTVLRITIEADLRPDEPIQRASMMVEYGQVKIGDSVRFCPVHSVSISVSTSDFQSRSRLIDSINRLNLNDVQFTSYRRFGSESRLVAALPPKSDNSDHPATSHEDPTPAGIAPAAIEDSVAATTVPTPVVNLDAGAKPRATVVPAESEPDNEIQIQPGEMLPALGGNNAKSAHSGNGKEDPDFTLRVSTRSVDLGLLVLDKHGKPVTDLKQDEIEVYDNGRRQQLRGFHHNIPNPVQSAQSSQPIVPAGTFTNATPAVAREDEAPDTLILMLDESHLAFNDLNRARGEMLRFLVATRPNARIALYAFSEQGFRVIQDVTEDHALVAKKLASWRPLIRAVTQGQDVDKRNNQQFDTIHPGLPTTGANDGAAPVPDYIESIDPQFLQMGQNPLRASLEGMVAVARHFAPVPGHKSLAWIAGDSVLADWQANPADIGKGPKPVDAPLLNAREALNEAHIALYAVDASAIDTAGPDASLANQNVMLNPTATVYSNPIGAPTRNTSADRAQGQLQADLHTIQGPVRQLVESTGGRVVNRGSDLKATLDGIEQDSTSLYELAFNPDTPADGKFHALQVKVPSRKDVILRYRTGYLYSEESQNTQQRFQQAVWSPQDATGIALTAHLVTASGAAPGQSAIELSIGFPGLSLEQKDSRWTGKLYVFVAERDDAVQKAEVSGDVVKLNLRQNTYGSGMPAGIPYHRNVDPKSKLGSIRIIVVDGNSGKMGSVTVPSSALHP